MKIHVETTDELSSLLPGSGEETTLELRDSASPHDALAALGISKDDKYLLVVNGAVVPRAERDELIMNDGDTLQILPPLKGG
ncbi:MAG: sulfur carrier protein ThiS [Hyphomicrobiaceae bacterium]